MSAARTRVYFAPKPFMGENYPPEHMSNIRALRLVVESHPGPRLDPSKWKLAGTVDAGTAALIENMDDEATLRLFLDRITPEGSEANVRAGLEQAMAELRGATETVPAATVPPKRGPGRPGWTTGLYRTRWAEAVERGKLSPPLTVERVAPYFAKLDDKVGTDPDYLIRLDRRHRRDETPE